MNSNDVPAKLAGFAQETGIRLLTRPHKITIILGSIALLWALGLGAYGISGLLSSTDPDSASALNFILSIVALGFAGQSLLYGVIQLITYYFSYLLITDKHICTLTGIARNVRSLKLEECDVHGFDESLLGRLLNYGYLNATGHSGSPIARFPIAHPDKALCIASRPAKAAPETES